MRTTSSELLIELDRSRPRGLRAQVEHQLRTAIREGRLADGTSLPSTRSLADDLGVTRGVIVATYDQLVAEGYLASTVGSGTVVINRVPLAQPAPAAHGGPDPEVLVDFSAGIPDLALFPRRPWARASRLAIETTPDADLGYASPHGLPELRRALVDYLGRVRGVNANPEQVAIGTGFSHGISVLLDALGHLGHRSIAVEDPHRGAGRQLAYSAMTVHGVPVDGEGLSVSALTATASRAVLVTPAHQAPTGHVLSPARRAALVAWARSTDGYVIEDDYDAEFRYDRHPVGALQGLAPDRVIYCGTASKTLAPGIRLGWMVLPPPIVELVTDVRRGTDVLTSTLLQATFAAFVRNGDLDRHLRRVRRLYRQRRDTLVAALDRHLPETTPTGISAGLQTLLELPADWEEARLAITAATRGVRLHALGDFRIGANHTLPPALFLGYGQLAPEDIERGVGLLAAAARDCFGDRTVTPRR